MLKVARSHFFEGPNVRSSRSCLVSLLLDEGPDPALAWRPGLQEAERVLKAVRLCAAVTAESAHLASPRALSEAPTPILHLLLATSEALLRDFTVEPAHGRLLGRQPGRCTVSIPADDRACAFAALSFSLELANAVTRLGEPSTARMLTESYQRARHAIRGIALNQSGIGLVRAAARRGIPHYRMVVPGQFVQLGQGRRAQRIMETGVDKSSILSRAIADDKLLTSRLLEAAGLPTPRTRSVENADEAVKAAGELGYPVVVKPRSSGKGRGVSVNLRSEADVRRAASLALAVGAGLIIERHVSGDDHRLLVVGGRFVAAARRDPASVTGDGRHTVKELVGIANRDPRRGMRFERTLERIDFDNEALHHIALAGLTPESVPDAGATVRLRGAANVSRGGSSTDLTETIHPDNIRLAERAAAAVGLTVTGIDFQTPDLTKSWKAIACAILEVNGTPGMRPHTASNPGRDVFGPVIEHLFPGDTPSRIPTIGVTGSVGKTSTCRLIAAMLAQAGFTTALATTQGAWVGGQQRKRGDHAGGAAAATLLTDPSVDAAVFELARGGLVKRGLVLDGCDVGVVMNVHDNHIGSDGIQTQDDLARVKRLVVERARHCAVLNADDPQCLAMRTFVKARVALVSREPGNAEIVLHRSRGGLGARFDAASGRLELFDGERSIGAMSVAAIPSTWEGRFTPAIDHALAAMVAAHAVGVGFGEIERTLGAYFPDDASNPGRMNLYRNLPHSLLVCHADGPKPVGEVAAFVQQLGVRGRKTILLCSAGDRTDAFIASVANAAAGAFDRYVCTDWSDLRGRKPREVAAMMASALAARGVPPEQIVIADDVHDAVRLGAAEAGPDDLIVDISYGDSDREEWLRARGLPVSAPVPASGVNAQESEAARRHEAIEMAALPSDARALASLDPATRAIVRVAQGRDIPWSLVDPDLAIVQFGHGRHGRRMRRWQADNAGMVSSVFAAERTRANRFLARHGLPVRGPVPAGANPPARTNLYRLLVLDGRFASCIPAQAVHPGFAALAQSAARLLRLPVVCVEFPGTMNLAMPPDETCRIEGVDMAPNIAAFIEAAPDAGIAQACLRMLVPEGAVTRVPTAAVTGSVGKTTTCTLVAAILSGGGLRVARSTTQGAWIGEDIVTTGDVAGGRAARRLLLDPSVEAGVFEMARGGLLRRGFVIDGVDVGAVLNVMDQHLGFEGLNTREDLARVKSMVASHARKAVVLNADDPLCLAMRDVTKAPVIVLVSMRADNPEVLAHRAAGGLAVWRDADSLLLCEGDRAIGSLDIVDMPTTHQGRFQPGVWHAMFAMGIAQALGLPFPQTAATLTRFQSTPRTNPGRMNLVEGLPYQLLVSHASGPEGMNELMKFVGGMAAEGRRTLLFSVAGNRSDDYIRRIGREAAAGGMDRYICSDWYLPRGRGPLEVARLLAEGLAEEGIAADRIVVGEFEESVKLAYSSAEANDLLVENTFTDASKAGWSALRFGERAAGGGSTGFPPSRE